MKRWEIAAVVALCGLIPVSRADLVVLDNTGVSGTLYQQIYEQAQVFTMGANENISSLTLVLSGSGSRDVQIWNWASGAPTTMVANGDLGNISVSPGNALSVSGVSLISGNVYAVVLGVTGSATLGWGYVNSSTYSSDDGSSLLAGGGLYYNNGTWTQVPNYNFQMNLDAVPEVPITGLVMGFGVLAITVGHTFRRKISQVL